VLVTFSRSVMTLCRNATIIVAKSRESFIFLKQRFLPHTHVLLLLKLFLCILLNVTFPAVCWVQFIGNTAGTP